MALESHEADPAVTDPALYKVVFENDRVRVLEYVDAPGDRTNQHHHPDSVMLTLSSFQRRVASGGHQVDIELPANQVRWIGAQDHVGENIGATGTHAFFVELKEPAPTGAPAAPSQLGPSAA